MRAALFGVLVFASIACSKKSGGLEDCEVSMGSCIKGSTSCGIKLACEKRTIELKCEPPADETVKSVQCQCSNVVGKKVDLDYPFHGNIKSVIATVCDLNREIEEGARR